MQSYENFTGRAIEEEEEKNVDKRIEYDEYLLWIHSYQNIQIRFKHIFFYW